MVTADKFSVLRTVTVDFAHVKIKKTWQKGFKPSEITIRSEEHTSELQSHSDLVCRLLLEKKKKKEKKEEEKKKKKKIPPHE